ALSGRSRYCVFSGACNALSSSAFMGRCSLIVRSLVDRRSLLITPGFSPVQPPLKRKLTYPISRTSWSDLRRVGTSRCDVRTAQRTVPTIGLRCCRRLLFGVRLNVLIHPKEIVGIVFVFDRNQPLIVVSVRRLHAIRSFVAHQKIY